MNQKLGLSVVIPTLNEEQDIANAITSVSDIASEIAVVDSGSTDKTVAIAESLGAKVYHHEFISFSDTRNFGDSRAKGDWIMSIEADVIVPKPLSEEINYQLQSTNSDAFYIERINQILGRSIMHSNWGPKDDCHIWLYRKNSGKWQGSVHEEYVCRSNKVERLKNRLLHHNYDTIYEFIEKLNKYSEISGNSHNKVSWFDGIIDFIKRYFYKQGFLDGYHGLFLCYLQATYFLTVYIKQHLQNVL